MNKLRLLGAASACAFTLFASSVHAVHIGGDTADKLNVPGDFPGSFYMDLLGIGTLTVELPDIDPANTTGYKIFDEVAFDPQGTQILFDATAFDGTGAGVGTSQLTLSSIDHWAIGTGANVAGFPPSFYIDGPGTGSLVDLGDGSGDWTLDVPLFVEWNGGEFTFDSFSLTTNASYGTTSFDVDSGAYVTTYKDGVAMDYHTGDAILVGQAVIDEPSPFTGLRITLAVAGNDPVISAVPVPPALWLFGTGLVGLVGLSKRKKIV